MGGSTRDGKCCPKCGEMKPFTGYYRNRTKPDGYQTYCKPCFNVANAASGARNAERRRAKQRETNKAYRERLGDAVRQKNRAWYAAKGRVYHKAWRASNPDRVRSAKARYNRAHPEANARSVRRYRARLVATGVHHTAEEWAALCARYDYRCLACGERKPLTKDHIIPLSRGGSDQIDNIQPLCKPCNTRKGFETTDYRY